MATGHCWPHVVKDVNNILTVSGCTSTDLCKERFILQHQILRESDVQNHLQTESSKLLFGSILRYDAKLGDPSVISQNSLRIQQQCGCFSPNFAKAHKQEQTLELIWSTIMLTHRYFVGENNRFVQQSLWKRIESMRQTV